MKTGFDVDLERPPLFLVEAMTRRELGANLTVLHSFRVGLYLQHLGYQRDIVLAGVLHGVLEDSATSAEDVAREFGAEGSNSVEACTKNPVLDRSQRDRDVLERCKRAGIEALLVKAADLLDSTYLLEHSPRLEQLLGKVKMCLAAFPEGTGYEVWQTLKRCHNELSSKPRWPYPTPPSRRSFPE